MAHFLHSRRSNCWIHHFGRMTEYARANNLFSGSALCRTQRAELLEPTFTMSAFQLQDLVMQNLSKNTQTTNSTEQLHPALINGVAYKIQNVAIDS